MTEFSQGICADGAAILKDGVMLTIEEIIELLRQGDKLIGSGGEPVAWISIVQCVGPGYGKELYGKLPVQSLQPGYYRHVPLYIHLPGQPGSAYPAAPDSIATCEWQEDADGVWETSCGEAWQCTEGTPVENDMKYCHSCGKHLKEMPYAAPGGE